MRRRSLGLFALSLACRGGGATAASTEVASSSTTSAASSSGPSVDVSSATAADTAGPVDGSSGSDASTTTSGSTTSGTASTGEDEPELGPNCVRRIYPTREDKAAPWLLGFDDWQDRIAQFGEVSGEGNFTVVEQSGQVRMTVLADPTSECDGLEDHGQALAQGYMCSPLDWSDFEMTGYVQLVVASNEPTNHDFTWYGATGRHTGDGWLEGCWGSGYKGSYDYAAAQVRIGKESWHVNYDWRAWTDVDGGLVLTRSPDAWLGMKMIRYRFERDGVEGVRNEVWLDLGGTIDASGCPSNDWQLAIAEEDHPDRASWGSQGSECMAPAEDQIIFWGGPHVTWRWDDTTARLRLMDVREIVAP